MILELLSFFIGFILLLLIAIVLMNYKKDKKLNGFFFVILGIVGIQRFFNGLETFELVESFSNPFQTYLIFALFIPVVYYLFFYNLLFKQTPYKKVSLHFSLPTLISILFSIFNPSLAVFQVVFFIYSSFYVVLPFILIKDNLYNRKNYKELIHFKSIKNWTLIMYGILALSYLLPIIYF